MSCQRLAGTGILVVVAVATWLIPTTAAGQSQPLTAWGEPDLQGVWDFRTVTPMERPEELAGQEFLTAEEAAGLEQRAVERQVDRPPREGDPGTYNQFWMDSGTNIVGTRRTSLITDPPDGRIPDLAPHAKRRQDELAEARTGVGDDVPRPGGWVEDVPVSVRCIVGFNSGPPMYPAAYNNNMQVFQAPGYVALFNEMGPAVRIISLDGRPHLPSGVRQWLGDSRGRWEGDTLVVETTNFLRETAFGRYAGSVGRLGGSGPNIQLVERFTRVDADTLLYEATVEDATTWVRPWTYAIPMRKSDQAVYEYACHEGNYGLENILAGALREAEAAGR